MNRTIAAKPLRLVLVACLVAAAFAVVVGGLGHVTSPEVAVVLLPFAAAAVSVAALAIALPRINRLAQGGHPATTPYSAVARASGIQAASLEQALPGLARVLAEGTRAQRAVVWLAVEQKLVSAAAYPAIQGGPGARSNLAALLAQPDVDHVVPVLDGSVLRAVLAIAKPGRPVTQADQRFMQDVANGAGLLLRGVQLNAELHERVSRAGELATELQASRQRLSQARDAERHRLIAELTQVTTGRLAALRTELAAAAEVLSGGAAGAERALQSIARARTGLDEVLDRFRLIARGVYPAVLRDQGPYGALEEVATDLPRPVRLSGNLARRLAWEVESGIYYLAASAMQQLAGRAAEQPLHVHLSHTEGRLAVRIDDPALATPAAEVLAALAEDVDRLAALGGDVGLAEDGTGGASLRAWLPDQLEPSIEESHP
ncbi:MAG TPA: hypothetical protein VIY28_07745 [Pseudonocardiaceae bacterium]